MTTECANWERQGFPSKKAPDQTQAIADDQNSPYAQMTMLASLEDSLESCDLETEQKKEQPAAKKVKCLGRSKGRTFLKHMEPSRSGPRTMLGALQTTKHPFKIAHKLPFVAFPIGDGGISDDVATLSGPLDTGGCSNMGNLSHHKEIHDQHTQFVDELICLQEESYKTINVGGIKGGVIITHRIRHVMPFIDKGEQCFITLGLMEDLPIDTLFGLGFQKDTKMTIDFGTKQVESAFLQKQFAVTFKEPRHASNPDSVGLQGNNTSHTVR
jgi:hypothetical protein